MPVHRRRFLLGGVAAVAGLTGPSRNASAAALAPAGVLSLYHIHTGEQLGIAYRENGGIVAGALTSIDYLLRDFRSGQVQPIDVGLLDMLSVLYDRFDRRGRFEVISGYRSPRTNRALRRVTTGVAEDSFHMYGRAIDVRLTGAATDQLHAAALELVDGGVGYYPASNFVHIDTGPLRSW